MSRTSGKEIPPHNHLIHNKVGAHTPHARFSTAQKEIHDNTTQPLPLPALATLGWALALRPLWLGSQSPPPAAGRPLRWAFTCGQAAAPAGSEKGCSFRESTGTTLAGSTTTAEWVFILNVCSWVPDDNLRGDV